MASILQRTSDTNAHPIDISSACDLKRHLGEIDIADGDIEKTADQFLYSTIKLEGVDTRAANLMKASIETLGGALAMRKEAQEFTVRETDIIVSGTGARFRCWPRGCAGSPSAWTASPPRSTRAFPRAPGSCRGAAESSTSRARPT